MWKTTLINLLERNRGLVVLLFCLPASLIFDLVLRTKTYLKRKLLNSSQTHTEKVADIQKHIARWHRRPREERKLICTARPNWLSLSVKFFQKDLCYKVPVDLYDILALDEKNMTVTVEPMVTVNEITHYLVPKGYTLAVTLEIGDATLGGLALATAMTTHSHIAGLYHENVLSYEVLLADGSVVNATKDEHVPLYNCLPFSHGSLGILVSLTVRIVKIKPYLKVTYVPVEGQKNYCDAIRKHSGADNRNQVVPNYFEATIYNKNQAVLMLGEYSDYDPKLPVNHVTRWYKPWFYKYAEMFLEKGEHTELIPLREYLLRHNRAIFWVVEAMIPFGNEPWFRFLFGWLLPPKPAFLKFTTTPGIRAMTFTRQVFQDIVLPSRQLEAQIDTVETLFDLYPLLIYPCRIYDHGTTGGQVRNPPQKYMVEGTDYAIYNDLGIYGVPGQVKNKKRYDAVEAMRKMEKFTRDIGGFTFLYADIFMTKEELAEMFDLRLYEEVRKLYGAEGAFPHLYEKVKPEIDLVRVGKEYEIK